MDAKIEGDYIEVKTRIKRTRKLTVAYNKNPGDGSQIPCIRFSGSFLQDIGFEIGKSYTMTVNRDGTLTLELVSEDDENGNGGLFEEENDD